MHAAHAPCWCAPPARPGFPLRRFAFRCLTTTQRIGTAAPGSSGPRGLGKRLPAHAASNHAPEYGQPALNQNSQRSLRVSGEGLPPPPPPEAWLPSPPPPHAATTTSTEVSAPRLSTRYSTMASAIVSPEGPLWPLGTS